MGHISTIFSGVGVFIFHVVHVCWCESSFLLYTSLLLYTHHPNCAAPLLFTWCVHAATTLQFLYVSDMLGISSYVAYPFPITVSLLQVFDKRETSSFIMYLIPTAFSAQQIFQHCPTIQTVGLSLTAFTLTSTVGLSCHLLLFEINSASSFLLLLACIVDLSFISSWDLPPPEMLAPFSYKVCFHHILLSSSSDLPAQHFLLLNMLCSLFLLTFST
jgi:hypothetical protein